MKHEIQALIMILRRLVRPVSALLALWCLWRISKFELQVFIPIGERNFISNISEFAAHYTSDAPIRQKLSSSVAKVTVAVNSLDRSVIHQAMETHKVQNEMHGYIHHIATNELVDDISEEDRQHRPRGAWSKPAYILSVLVAELAKPEDERLEWILYESQNPNIRESILRTHLCSWFDADTVVMNPHTPLEIFLPPNNFLPEVSKINLLISSNWDGLNTGAFALRVCPWSVSFMSLVLAYPVYQVQKLQTDRFRDQSAIQWLLQSHESPLASSDTTHPRRNHWDRWVEIPMRWFNSLPINNAFSTKQDWIFNHKMTQEYFDNGTDVVFDDGWGLEVKPWKVMRGDMVVHFAGATPVRDSWMGPWLERAESRLPAWSNATKFLDLQAEAAEFWNTTSQRMVYEREDETKRYIAKPVPTGSSKNQPQSAKVNFGKRGSATGQDMKQAEESNTVNNISKTP